MICLMNDNSNWFFFRKLECKKQIIQHIILFNADLYEFPICTLFKIFKMKENKDHATECENLFNPSLHQISQEWSNL